MNWIGGPFIRFFRESSDTDGDKFHEYDDKDGDDGASGPDITNENPFYTVPNVIAAVASVTRDIDAKLTYGRVAPTLCLGFYRANQVILGGVYPVLPHYPMV
jgi:hypothetical protein